MGLATLNPYGSTLDIHDSLHLPPLLNPGARRYA